MSHAKEIRSLINPSVHMVLESLLGRGSMEFFADRLGTTRRQQRARSLASEPEPPHQHQENVLPLPFPMAQIALRFPELVDAGMPVAQGLDPAGV